MWSCDWKSTIDEFIKQCVPADIHFLDILCIDDYPPNNKGKPKSTIKNLNTVWIKHGYREDVLIFDNDYYKIHINGDKAVFLNSPVKQNVNQMVYILKRY